MITRSFVFLPLAMTLLAGCARNVIWTKPDSYSMPVALASRSSKTAEFTFRRARYWIHLIHHTPCGAMARTRSSDAISPFALPRYNPEIKCDITIAIHRERADGPVVFSRHITKARIGWEGHDDAGYNLGYFETSRRGKLVMVVSNAPSHHDDSICHAQLEVCEILTK